MCGQQRLGYFHNKVTDLVDEIVYLVALLNYNGILFLKQKQLTGQDICFKIKIKSVIFIFHMYLNFVVCNVIAVGQVI